MTPLNYRLSYDAAEGIKQLDGVRQLQSGSIQVIPSSAIPRASLHGEIRVNMGVLIAEREPYQWDILKSIVYGGLIESITSLGLVSAAAGSNAGTRMCSSITLLPWEYDDCRMKPITKLFLLYIFMNSLY